MVAQCFIKVPFVGNPPPLQLGTPTGPIRGRLGSWYPSIIWKNLRFSGIPYYKIGSHIHTTGTSKCVYEYTHHGSLITRSGPIYTPPRTTKNHQEPQEPQVCVRVYTPPRVIIKKNRVPYYKIGSLICITGTSGSPSVCTSTHTTGPICTPPYYCNTTKVQVVLQRYRLYHKVCVGSSGSYEYTHHKVCVYTHHKGNTVVLNNTNTNW